MSQCNVRHLPPNNPYISSLTREQFLFFEMRTTAKLMRQGLDDCEILARIEGENLFQYPTEKSVKKIAKCCINRLHTLNDPSLVNALAEQSSDVAKQICLYAMMKHSRLVWDFMVSVIGEKFQQRDFTFGKLDINVFFMRLQEQDDVVASWSVQTITRIIQVLIRVLVENDYLDSARSEPLNPVLIPTVLENAIRASGDERALAAFNCF